MTTQKEKSESKKEHKEGHKAEHKPKSLKIKKVTMWQAVSGGLAVLLIISIALGPGKSLLKGGASGVGEETVEFITEVMMDNTQTATLKNATIQNDMYMVNFEVDGKVYPAYVSKDGNLLFFQAIDMPEARAEVERLKGLQDETETAAPEAVKSDKPKVEVFVMSHCPFGTQIEKGVIPVAELLGDKIDFEIKFVYYAMHGKVELDEQLLQYCVQKEQNGKYLDYLKCFLEDGDTERCVSEVGLDKSKIDSCVSAADEEFKVTEMFEDKSTWLKDSQGNPRFPLFNVDQELNQQYEVKGSPQLVINGQTSNARRDSASLLGAVCGSFNEAPAECETELSAANPSAGFGYEESASAATGSCG